MKFTILLMLINMILNLTRYYYKTKLDEIYWIKFTATILYQEFSAFKLIHPSITSTNVLIYLKVDTTARSVTLFTLMKRVDAEKVIKNLDKGDDSSEQYELHKLEFYLGHSNSILTEFLLDKDKNKAFYKLLNKNNNFDGIPMKKEVFHLFENNYGLGKVPLHLRVNEDLKAHIAEIREEAF
jgi:hypothetical protein